MYKNLCLSLVVAMSAVCVDASFTGPMEVHSYQVGTAPHSFDYTYRVGDSDQAKTEHLTVKDVRTEACAHIMFAFLKLRHQSLDTKVQEAMERLSNVYDKLKCFDLENEVVSDKGAQK